MINFRTGLYAILLVSLCAHNKICAQELRSGVYFLGEDAKNCLYVVTNKDQTKSYCTGANPLIAISEFESISVLYKGDITSFFEISLNSSGQAKLKSMLNTQIKIQFGLLQNGELLGVIDTRNGTVYDKFRIFDSTANSDNIELIRRSLLTLLSE